MYEGNDMNNKLKSKIIICDRIQVDATPSGPQNTIIDILPIIEVAFIPTYFTFTISCQLLGDFQNQSSTHIIVKLLDPKQEQVAELGNIKLLEILQKFPDAVDNITLNFELRNAPLLYSGDYVIQLFADEQKIQEEIVTVRKRETDGNVQN